MFFTHSRYTNHRESPHRRLHKEMNVISIYSNFQDMAIVDILAHAV